MKIRELLEQANTLILENFQLALKDFSVDNNVETVKSELDRFRRLQSRISDARKKDINYWRKLGFSEFVKFLNATEAKDSKRRRIRRVKAASDEILTVKKTENSHLFFPLSKDASCFYGSGTPWCISTRDGKNYFYQYTIHGNSAVCFLVYKDGVYALVFDPHTFDITECQDKNNNNSLPVDRFLEMAGVTAQQLLAFTQKNYDTIFSEIKKSNNRDLEKDLPKLVAEHSEFIEKVIEAIKDYSDGESANHIRDMLISLKRIFHDQYAKFFELYIEQFIAKSATLSYYYASDVIGERFELGEPAIAKNGRWACYYARHVLNDRFPAAEPAIAKSAIASLQYAMFVLGHERFELGEPAIFADPEIAVQYSKALGKPRLKEAERVIATDRRAAVYYAEFSPEHRKAMRDLGVDV